MLKPPEPRPLSKAAIILLVMLVTTFAPLLALAEEVVDEIVVGDRPTRYSATKSDTPIMETARSVSIEDRQALIDKGAINLADTYLYAAGVFGEAYGFATRGDWVKVRGLDVPEYRVAVTGAWGTPVALGRTATTQVVFGLPSTGLFSLVMLASIVLRLRLRDARHGARLLEQATAVSLGLLLFTYVLRFGEHAVAPAAPGVNASLAVAALAFAWLARRPLPGVVERRRAVSTA